MADSTHEGHGWVYPTYLALLGKDQGSQAVELMEKAGPAIFAASRQQYEESKRVGAAKS